MGCVVNLFSSQEKKLSDKYQGNIHMKLPVIQQVPQRGRAWIIGLGEDLDYILVCVCTIQYTVDIYIDRTKLNM